MKRLFIIIFLLNCFFCFAQKNGFVLDSKNTPIENVEVLFADQNIITHGEYLYRTGGGD